MVSVPILGRLGGLECSAVDVSVLADTRRQGCGRVPNTVVGETRVSGMKVIRRGPSEHLPSLIEGGVMVICADDFGVLVTSVSCQCRVGGKCTNDSWAGQAWRASPPGRRELVKIGEGGNLQTRFLAPVVALVVALVAAPAPALALAPGLPPAFALEPAPELALQSTF